jgi:hypothetical protein
MAQSLQQNVSGVSHFPKPIRKSFSSERSPLHLIFHPINRNEKSFAISARFDAANSRKAIDSAKFTNVSDVRMRKKNKQMGFLNPIRRKEKTAEWILNCGLRLFKYIERCSRFSERKTNH